jgi:DNA-binding MarR family transcriptional regulator
MTERKEQIAGLVENFRALSKAMGKFGPSFLNELNITYTQMLILGLVKENEGISLKNLAGMMGTTSSAATQQVDSLVRRGYLLRHESDTDRRLVMVRLTGEMDKQVEAMKTKFLEQLSPLFDRLTNEELAQYSALTAKIAGKVLQQ